MKARTLGQGSGSEYTHEHISRVFSFSTCILLFLEQLRNERSPQPGERHGEGYLWVLVRVLVLDEYLLLSLILA